MCLSLPGFDCWSLLLRPPPARRFFAPTAISGAGWILPLVLIAQRLQLGDGLQISRATGRPLDLDQPVQVQTSAGDAEQRELNGIVLEILVPTAAYDFAEEIQRSQIGDQSEIEATFDRVAIQAKWKTGGSSS
jgi:hypothetical protein